MPPKRRSRVYLRGQHRRVPIEEPVMRNLQRGTTNHPPTIRGERNNSSDVCGYRWRCVLTLVLAADPRGHETSYLQRLIKPMSGEDSDFTTT